MKIFDAFMFCHELDLLELRLRLLYDYVDRFVLLECDHSLVDRPKPMYFSDNKDRYAQWADKITHVPVSGPLKKQWQQKEDLYSENAQRQILYDSTKALSSDPTDILILSDVDEIPGRDGIEHLRKADLKHPIVFRNDCYYYNIKCPLRRKFDGAVAVRSSYDIKSAKRLRTDRQNLEAFEDGWHLSYFMSVDDIIIKLTSFAHASTYGRDDFVREDIIKSHINNRTSLLGKKFGNDEPKPLPSYLIEEMKRFPLFMGESVV